MRDRGVADRCRDSHRWPLGDAVALAGVRLAGNAGKTCVDGRGSVALVGGRCACCGLGSQ